MPKQTILLPTEARSLQQCLDSIAELSHTETTYFEDIVYFAPTNQAPQIEFDYWQLATSNLPEIDRKIQPEFRWNSPQDFQTLFKKYRTPFTLTVENSEKIPWDVWAPKTIPQGTARFSTNMPPSRFSFHRRNQEQTNRLPSTIDFTYTSDFHLQGQHYQSQ